MMLVQSSVTARARSVVTPAETGQPESTPSSHWRTTGTLVRWPWTVKLELARVIPALRRQGLEPASAEQHHDGQVVGRRRVSRRGKAHQPVHHLLGTRRAREPLGQRRGGERRVVTCLDETITVEDQRIAYAQI